MPATDPETLTIGQVSSLSGVSRSAIRFYEARGVLRPPERVSGRRRYRREVLRELAVIKATQAAGFSLDEIREVLRADRHSGERMRELARRRAPKVEREIARLREVRRWLRTAERCACRDLRECELLHSPG
jgi:DNA-binding transcriptional MerR regulator